MGTTVFEELPSAGSGPRPAGWETLTPAERRSAAQDFIRGKSGTVVELQALAAALKDCDKRFSHARRLLLRARRHADFNRLEESKRRKLLQQLALCTYKDEDLPADRRFQRALEWLREIAPFERLGDQESLCLTGAIYKRQWESTGQHLCLRESLRFYTRGHQAAPPSTPAYDGYAAINIAFVCDLLAREEAKTDRDSNAVHEYREKARGFRAEIVELLPQKIATASPSAAWWLYVTLAEAHLGLQQYQQASQTLESALQLPNVFQWQRESTARQLASLAHVMTTLVGPDSEAAYGVIREAFNLSAKASDGLALGRFGLALSGGGFRASLFHIGVLARLAELDLLRHVEVLSCVSGGSIIGACYFLELRRQMLETSDGEMTQQHYIDIVGRIERDFLAGVQTNLRSSLATNLWASLQMIFSPHHSRTTRIGDLYQTRLFDRISQPVGESGDEASAKPIFVGQLPFCPKDEAPGFNPKSDNWRRGAKVPMLVLNATTLNTGHNWQFTATWMGEAATTIDNRIDSGHYYRRMYYDEAPEPYRKKGIRLGHAVAASSCVPGLFPALKLPRLFKGVPVVRLVDGGVHDNQGVAALLDQDCAAVFVSDASGQLKTDENPAGGLFGGPSRANGVLQARVRLAQYRELDARRRSGAMRAVGWVHLREELEPNAIDWNGCLDPFSREDEGLTDKAQPPLLPYGIHRDIQDALSRIRTDLDSFSDAEAHALMCSAYQMTRTALDHPQSNFAGKPSVEATWRFNQVLPHLKSPDSLDTGVGRAIRVGEHLPLKVWRLSPVLAGVSAVGISVAGVLALSLITLGAARMGWLSTAAIGLKSPTVAVLFALAATATIGVGRFVLARFGGAGELLERSTVGVATLLLFVPMWVQRRVFDAMFLESGRYQSK